MIENTLSTSIASKHSGVAKSSTTQFMVSGSISSSINRPQRRGIGVSIPGDLISESSFSTKLTLFSLLLHFKGLVVAFRSVPSPSKRSSARFGNPHRSATIEGNQPLWSLIICSFFASSASIISLFPFKAAVSRNNSGQYSAVHDLRRRSLFILMTR